MSITPRTYFHSLLVVVAFGLLAGCASVPPEQRDESDPLEGFNRAMFSFNETVDGLIVKPAATLYNDVLPEPVNKGVTNIFGNIEDVVVFANDLFQFKFEHALHDLGRITFNSTIGLLGVLDVATHMGMKKRDEDFGQTLGYWGVGNGPYLVLPVFGPSSIRDGFGLIVDAYIDPINDIDDNSTRNTMIIVEAIDIRADLLSASKVFDEAALDRYLFIRDAYLQRRLNQVHDGNPPKQLLYNNDK